MREILFRGKRMDNGEWAEGSLLKVTINGKTAYLIFGDNFSFDGNDVKALGHALVDPATVGQYTGLQDKNGKQIFEGDIVALERGWGEKVMYTIEYDSEICSFIGDSVNYIGFTTFEDDGDRFEVIGNIHDNPELVGGAE